MYPDLSGSTTKKTFFYVCLPLALKWTDNGDGSVSLSSSRLTSGSSKFKQVNYPGTFLQTETLDKIYFLLFLCYFFANTYVATYFNLSSSFCIGFS